ncbi:MAG: DoxX family protein [Taibaiella sp.]|nr:DoxX family protein [Taibaiella sp.]
MRLFFLYLMAALYVAAGINHFVHPVVYTRIMPRYLPWHLQIVYGSGVLEILLGLLLLPSGTRVIAAWGLIVLLIAIFPANVQMAVDQYHNHDKRLWIAIVRLPLQIPLIWWAWLYTRSA